MYDPSMVTKHQQSANDARKRADTAKESSDRHSSDALQMRREANEAAGRLTQGRERQRKREARKNLPKR